ncbi:hypothetical protein FOL47_010237 [Perkinsus chesapeaki]|uniref:START domain-containing protein n=1 Tax=Perkinsus chesapeaki TaxID=330153 RepID=A0A7J6L356_PERCH|nr:hypothetical protein FOL47_010237 [Perkinsus chesapeaki]
MGCLSSKSSTTIVLDPRQLKRSNSGRHLQFEVPSTYYSGGPIIEEVQSDGGDQQQHSIRAVIGMTGMGFLNGSVDIEVTRNKGSGFAERIVGQMDISTAATSTLPEAPHAQISPHCEDFLDCLSDHGNSPVEEVIPPVQTKLDETSQKFLEAAKSAQAQFLHYLTPEGKAEFRCIGKAGAVDLIAKDPPPGEPFPIVAGSRSFGAEEIDLNFMLDLLMDPATRYKYNPQAGEGEILRRGMIDEPHRRLDVHYAEFKGLFTVSARDCVYAILRERINENLWMVSWQSVEVPECPEGSRHADHVRSHLICCGYAIEIDPRTKDLTVTMVNRANPAGNVHMIPGWVALKGLKGQPASLNNLYGFLKGK